MNTQTRTTSPIDRAQLRRATADARRMASAQTDDHPVARILASIHRQPDSREWVPLEARALAPIAFVDDGSWKLLALLQTGAHPPFAAVVWDLATGAVVRRIDLASSSANSDGANTDCANSDDAADSGTAAARSSLIAALDDALAQTHSGSPDAVRSLADGTLPKLYRAALHAPIRNLYRTLIPACQEYVPGDDAPIGNAASGEERAISVRDVSPRLSGWLRDAGQIAESLGASMAPIDALLLRRRAGGASFRLAVVGEFSRGKSALLNRLLGRDLLPTRATPTTAALTIVTAAPLSGGEWMRRCAGNRVLEKQALADAADSEPFWSAVAADPAHETPGDRAETMAETMEEVRLEIAPTSWPALFGAGDVELIDTPGANDLSAPRTALTQDLLGRCDAAVFVLSCLSPFSLTEKLFLTDQVLGQHISRTLVVVSMLDRIGVAEREAAFADLTERVRATAPGIAVLPTYALRSDEVHDHDAALEMIRRQIESIAHESDRRLWRSQQIAWQLHTVVDGYASAARLAADAARADLSTRRVAADVQAQRIAEAASAWESLLVEFDSRRLGRDAAIQSQIHLSGREVSELLTLEAQRTQDPRAFYERELPFRLRRELGGLSIRLGQQTIHALTMDTDWLAAQVAARFGARLNRPAVSREATGLETDANGSSALKPLALKDIGRLRLLARLGTGAISIPTFLISGPLGMAVSLGVGVASERYWGAQLQEQRERVSAEVGHAVERTTGVFYRLVSERLSGLYRQVAEDTRRTRQSGDDARLAALRRELESADGGDPAALDTLAARADTLCSSIGAHLYTPAV